MREARERVRAALGNAGLNFPFNRRVTVNLALAQQARGHHVSVFSIVDTEGLKAELLQAGIPVTEGHKEGSLDRQTLGLLRALLKARRADIARHWLATHPAG